jgi:hypothetical protein
LTCFANQQPRHPQAHGIRLRHVAARIRPQVCTPSAGRHGGWSSCPLRHLSLAKTPSGGQVVDRSARSFRGRIGAAVGLHVSMVSIQETIPRPPVRFLALYAHLPADGRWEGRGTPPARLKATPISLADASRLPGPGQGLRISVGDPPCPFDPSVSPSTVRTIRGPSGLVEPLEDLADRGWADAGAEARGDPTTPES